MNLFHKKTTSHVEKEEEFTDKFKYQALPDSEETGSAGVGNKERGLYHLNPSLFRRLIEGTSLDRRKKIKTEEQITRTEQKQAVAINSQKNIVSKRTPALKKVEKKVFIDAAGKRKKFINKERENKLGNIVKEILGYPKKQNS